VGVIHNTVSKIVKKYKSNNPFTIAKLKGIVLLYADLGETLGFYFYDSRIKFININNKLDENLQRFVCAHELGHAVLHPKSNTPFLKRQTLFSTDKIEREANEFAVHLLLHGENLEDYETKYDILRENGIPLGMERFL
jgi:Zn-dependent peptidase ImmA (M78 family)